MSTFTCTACDLSGNWVSLPAPTSVKYQMPLFTPAASATLTFGGIPYAAPLKEFKLSLSGSVLLHSTVDTYIQSRTPQGTVSTLKGRDIVAAGMADNEVEPGYRFQLSRDDLLANFATPWGATGADLPDESINYIIYTRLMTHFDAIALFCRQCYGSVGVFMNREHALRTSPFTGTSRNISSGSFCSAELSFNRKQPSSLLYIQTAQTDYGYEFGESASSAVAAEYGITRVGYYSPSQKWYRNPILGAEHLLREAHRGVKQLTVTLPGAVLMEAGDTVDFTDPQIGTFSGMYVSEHRLTADENGISTTVVLYDSAYLA